MYQPLSLEKLSIDNELARIRLATLSNRPRPQAPASSGRRTWWPRPRRSALRLAFAGFAHLGSHRAARQACADC